MPFPAYWRLVYGSLGTSAAERAVALGLRAARRVGGQVGQARASQALLRVLSVRGWPPVSGYWVNVHASRLLAAAYRRNTYREPGARQRPLPARPPTRPKVGVFGPFRGLLSFPRALFQAFPRDAELHVFDLEFDGGHADYLKEVAHAYHPVPVPRGPWPQPELREAAAAANGAGLDVLVNFYHRAVASDFLELVDAPFVVNVCTGSDILHHPKVSMNLYVQPQADYALRDSALFCGTSRTTLAEGKVREAFLFMDRRGLEPGVHTPWSGREPWMVYHGSLYKLASPPLLRGLAGLLREDPARRLLYFGKDDGRSLEVIRRTLEREGAASQASYEGQYNATRDASGRIGDPGWARVVAALERSRLAPDPWPYPGASARFEAFCMGVPSVHLAVRDDTASWGRPQPAWVETPYLTTVRGTATTAEAYTDLCRRALTDRGFAEALVQEQLEVARRVSDPVAWWAQVFDAYADAHGADGDAMVMGERSLPAVGRARTSAIPVKER